MQQGHVVESSVGNFIIKAKKVQLELADSRHVRACALAKLHKLLGKKERLQLCSKLKTNAIKLRRYNTSRRCSVEM